MTKRRDYKLASHFNKGSCDEEEEYQLISEKEDEEEAPNPYQQYDIPATPHTSPGPEVISRNTSPIGFFDHNNNNSGNNNQGSSTSRSFNSTIPRVNRMDGNDINLLIVNGNGLEDLEQH